MLALGGRSDVRVFRNTVGAGWMGDAKRLGGGSVLIERARYVTFGLAPGSSDLIGWHSIIVTPEMVGQRVARFLAPELKTAHGPAREQQSKFIRAVNESGGAAGLVRSIPDAERLVS